MARTDIVWYSGAVTRSPKTDLDKAYDANIDIYLGKCQPGGLSYACRLSCAYGV